MMLRLAFLLAAPALLLAAPSQSWAQPNADELARQLSNPVANLISVPLQTNFEFGGGDDNDGFGLVLDVEPVIPFPLNSQWLVISRTILPIAYYDYLPPDDETFGLGDITQSLFFSPRQSSDAGLTWGVGPAFLLPTATDDVLGTGKWGAGPSAVILRNSGAWTIGALANHIWSFAGDDDRDHVSSTFVQPFAAYHLSHGRTITVNTETSYDWEHEEWTVPINLAYSQVFMLGQQHMSAAIGGKYYVDSPEGAAQWGIRATLTFVFPERHS